MIRRVLAALGLAGLFAAGGVLLFGTPATAQRLPCLRCITTTTCDHPTTTRPRRTTSTEPVTLPTRPPVTVPGPVVTVPVPGPTVTVPVPGPVVTVPVDRPVIVAAQAPTPVKVQPSFTG